MSLNHFQVRLQHPLVDICFFIQLSLTYNSINFSLAEKLHRLLMEVEGAGRSDVISFVASGRAFAIHKPDKFFKEIVPLYFRQSRLSSFKRQLNLYGFELINTGPARGGYYHDLFQRDRPELCRRMRRVAVKVGSDAKKGKSNDPTEEESFPLDGPNIHHEDDHHEDDPTNCFPDL